MQRRKDMRSADMISNIDFVSARQGQRESICKVKESSWVPSQAWFEQLRYYPTREQELRHGDSRITYSGNTHGRNTGEHMEFDVRTRLGIGDADREWTGDQLQHSWLPKEAPWPTAPVPPLASSAEPKFEARKLEEVIEGVKEEPLERPGHHARSERPKNAAAPKYASDVLRRPLWEPKYAAPIKRRHAKARADAKAEAEARAVTKAASKAAAKAKADAETAAVAEERRAKKGAKKAKSGDRSAQSAFNVSPTAETTAPTSSTCDGAAASAPATVA